MLILTPELCTGDAEIDRHHADFIEALNAIDAVADHGVIAALDRLIAHCETHFEFENAQMKASNFPPIGCHLSEHEMVTETVREVRRHAAEGNPAVAKNLGPALAQWFENHVQSMDAVLARYLAQPPEMMAAAPALTEAPACGVPA